MYPYGNSGRQRVNELTDSRKQTNSAVQHVERQLSRFV